MRQGTHYYFWIHLKISIKPPASAAWGQSSSAAGSPWERKRRQVGRLLSLVRKFGQQGRTGDDTVPRFSLSQRTSRQCESSAWLWLVITPEVWTVSGRQRQVQPVCVLLTVPCVARELRAESCTLGGERTTQRVKLGKLSGRDRVSLGCSELRGFGEY